MTASINGFSARSVPFYGLPKSRIVSDAPTAHDAMVLAGLDWHVSVEPTYQTLRDGTVRQVPNRFLTVRQDTESVLGSVGKVYAPFQNADSFSFADRLLGYGVEFDAAASYANDSKVFLTAKLPEGITVPGTDDSLDLYLLFKNSHDGSSAISAMITPIRLSCTNMMNLAAKKMLSSWNCRHTATASEKIDEAARTLGLVDAYRTAFADIATQLRETEVNLEGFTKLIQEVTDSERNQAGAISVWQTSPTVDRQTGWGSVNAIGEYFEHERGGKGNVESRFDANLSGQTAQARNRAVQLLLNRR